MILKFLKQTERWQHEVNPIFKERQLPFKQTPVKYLQSAQDGISIQSTNCTAWTSLSLSLYVGGTAA